MLTNTQDYPLVDVPVALLDAAGSVVWEGRTDNTGTAELWAGMFDAEWKKQAMSARVFYKGKTISINNLKSFDKGINKKQIKTACGASQKVDIMWAVDATGSMGDELEYLKSELLDVIGRVQAINPDLSIRIGSAFYRDKGDEYIVKSSGLSSNITQTVEYIKKQAANGGGDYPEAVHSALEEAILNQNWEAEAVTRICFLVLDASPHQEPEVIESLHKSIREAARKGIRIVPVSASGVQKDTEFLMKFFGLATNGSYVFLTDHSGIGGKHLAPTTDEYKVEQLNDLLVRIITEYSTVVDCNGKTAIRFEDQQQNNQEPLEQALYYPNPSSTQFTLELPFDVEKVTLYNSEGQAVKNYTELRQGRHTVVVNDLPAGFYTLRIWKDGRVQSGKVLVAHS
jgi:septum formation topological specificity factor MinE